MAGLWGKPVRPVLPLVYYDANHIPYLSVINQKNERVYTYILAYLLSFLLNQGGGRGGGGHQQGTQ